MHVKVCYPDAVLNIRDIKAIIDAGDRIGEALENDLDELDANIDIKSAKESGISRREKILGINPLDTTGLEDRRLEVLARWYDTPVYTETTLRNKLDSIMGILSNTAGQIINALQTVLKAFFRQIKLNGWRFLPKHLTEHILMVWGIKL